MIPKCALRVKYTYTVITKFIKLNKVGEMKEKRTKITIK